MFAPLSGANASSGEISFYLSLDSEYCLFLALLGHRQYSTAYLTWTFAQGDGPFLRPEYRTYLHTLQSMKIIERNILHHLSIVLIFIGYISQLLKTFISYTKHFFCQLYKIKICGLVVDNFFEYVS